MIKRHLGTPILAVVFVMAACATTGGGGADTVRIRVNNNLTPPSSLTISIVDETSVAPQFIGAVTPSSTETLTFDTGIASGRYRLVAETVGGAEIVSRPFTLGGPATVVWDVQSNTIRIMEGVDQTGY